MNSLSLDNKFWSDFHDKLNLYKLIQKLSKKLLNPFILIEDLSNN